MLLKTLKYNHNTEIPAEMETETRFNIGDTINLEYDYKENRYDGYSYYRTFEKKGIAEFTVTDMYLNTLISPHEVVVILTTTDNLFKRRCKCTQFSAFETNVIGRIRA